MGSSDFDAAQIPPDIDGRITSDTIHSVGVHQKDTSVRSRAASSQSHVLPTKHGAANYLQDPNARPESTPHHGRTSKDKKSSGGSLKRIESGKPGGRHQQKASSKKGHAQSEKQLRRSESFTTASQGGTNPLPRDQRKSSQQGNIHEYQYKDGLADSDIDRMVLPPPPPLNMERRDVQFDALSSTLQMVEQDHQHLQMPPPNFSTDGVVSFQGYSQSQLQPQQEATPSSPLAVIRNKRANQANWEKARKSSLQRATDKEVTSVGLGKSIFQGRLYLHTYICILTHFIAAH